MKEFTVDVEGGYKVYIDSTLDKFIKALKENKINIKEKFFLITDDVVYSIYKEKIEGLKQSLNLKEYYFKCGEENKNIHTIQDIYSFLIHNEANRESVIIALGGGIVGDLVGFVAATYMRGVTYINIPTTFLSQVDSCIGGKVGYNYKGIKNIIGDFYNPKFVFVSTNFLKTLKEKQFKDGLGEVIKYALIDDDGMIKYIDDNYKGILERENDKMLHIVKKCLEFKKNTVESDFKDLGLRNILNFGHTVAHGIEMTSQNKITHGEAVALGILTAIRISEKKLNLSKNTYKQVECLYKKLGLPTKYKVDNYNLFMYAINHDKKNNDKIRFVLLEDFGKPKIKVEINEEVIINSIKESIDREE